MDSGGLVTPDFKYRAFISYSHCDRRVAEWLHKAIENYRIPQPLINRPGRDGVIPKQVFPIFRDREELGSSSDLSASIREALTQSAYLIVICSPSSAKSRWVNQEIVEFKQLGRANRIHALIVDGEPCSGSADTECFPPALRFKLGANGELDESQSAEPLAADLRSEGEGKTEAKLKLIAGLLGISFNNLRQREVIAARKRARIVQAIASAIVLLTVSVGLTARYAYVFFNVSEERQIPSVRVEKRQTTLDLSGWKETTDADIKNRVRKSLAVSTNKFTIVKTHESAKKFIHVAGTTSDAAPEVRCNGCQIVPRDASGANRARHEWNIIFDIATVPVEEKLNIEFSFIFWNAFQNPEQWWGGYRILHATGSSLYTIRFPITKHPLPGTFSYRYSDGRGEHMYDTDVQVTFVKDAGGRVAELTWEVANPVADRSYRVYWDWNK